MHHPEFIVKQDVTLSRGTQIPLTLLKHLYKSFAVLSAFHMVRGGDEFRDTQFISNTRDLQQKYLTNREHGRCQPVHKQSLCVCVHACVCVCVSMWVGGSNTLMSAST